MLRSLLKCQPCINTRVVIYSTDQGYHLGSYRQGGGKSTPYLRDSNIPLVVRGPGIQAGVSSRTPSTVTDFAPTFLEIAGLSKEYWPSFLDGESLLASWESPNNTAIHKKKEAINVEFWGYAFNEIPSYVMGDEGKAGYFLKNDYKTMRIVGDDSAWLYSRWCTNDTELYDTKVSIADRGPVLSPGRPLLTMRPERPI